MKANTEEELMIFRERMRREAVCSRGGGVGGSMVGEMSGEGEWLEGVGGEG